MVALQMNIEHRTANIGLRSQDVEPRHGLPPYPLEHCSFVPFDSVNTTIDSTVFPRETIDFGGIFLTRSPLDVECSMLDVL